MPEADANVGWRECSRRATGLPHSEKTPPSSQRVLAPTTRSAAQPCVSSRALAAGSLPHA